MTQDRKALWKKYARILVTVAVLILAYIFIDGGMPERQEQERPTSTTSRATQVDPTQVNPTQVSTTQVSTTQTEANAENVVFDQPYYSAEDVAEYLHVFTELPPNYLTKKEAEEAGWVASEGNLWEVQEGAVIGGDRFGNREGLLPEKRGRQYFEADVNYEGGFRGAERLVYSNDGLIYYTDDHYASYERIY